MLICFTEQVSNEHTLKTFKNEALLRYATLKCERVFQHLLLSCIVTTLHKALICFTEQWAYMRTNKNEALLHYAQV